MCLRRRQSLGEGLLCLDDVEAARSLQRPRAQARAPKHAQQQPWSGIAGGHGSSGNARVRDPLALLVLMKKIPTTDALEPSVQNWAQRHTCSACSLLVVPKITAIMSKLRPVLSGADKEHCAVQSRNLRT